jgi:dehydrogenase/reductase SDR family member 7B
MSFTLKDKTVWITGASSGIGEAMAYEFARLGANLVLSGRRETELKRVAAACSSVGCYIQPLDLERPDEFPSIVSKVLADVQKVDILVNNAGISQRGLAKDTLVEVDKRLIDVNLLGTIAVTKALLPHFIENKSGHFVTISSLMGKFGGPMRSSYAAAKHGLHGFFDSIRAELWKDNIKVTLICPGFIQTDISIKALTGNGKEQRKMDEATKNGLPVDVFAKKAVRAILHEKEEVNIAGKELIGVYMKRFAPGLLSRLIRTAKVV